MPRTPHHAFPIPYAVDFTEENKGRHLDSTKRKITWKFGFANPPAVFPHLYENDEYVGFSEERLGKNMDAKKIGVDCRGREHEIVLVWSLVSGKAHLYVDNKELYRHTPPSDEIFNPFTAQFHKGFDLPNSRYNGHHRLDIRCYSRIPLGAKNMSTDGYGGKFHQYDLSVDGLSYFSMPAVYELGTEKMWTKIDKWGMMRQESMASGDNCTTSEEDDAEELRNKYSKSTAGSYDRWNEIHDSGRNGRTGRLEDEYYFDKAHRSKSYDRYGKSISGSEYKAMNPKNENEEERMIRIAMQNSMRDLDKNNHVSIPSPHDQRNTRQVKSDHNVSRLAAVGEDENLIDFGEDSVHDLSRGMSQIAFSQPSDVSVLGDDDATVASFMMPLQQPAGFHHQPRQQAFYPNNQPFQQQMYHQAPPIAPGFHDPTFNIPSPTTPRNGFNDAASFAYAPPPTWDDYKNAFGGSVRMSMDASVLGGSMMSPMSAASPMNGSATFVPQQQHQQQPPVVNGFTGSIRASNQFASPNHLSSQQPATNTGKNSMFDPLRNDPFAS